MHTEKFTDIATLIHSDVDLEGWEGSWEFQDVRCCNIGVVPLLCPLAVLVTNLFLFVCLIAILFANFWITLIS